MNIGIVALVVIGVVAIVLWVGSLAAPDDNEILDGLRDEDVDELLKPRK